MKRKNIKKVGTKEEVTQLDTNSVIICKFGIYELNFKEIQESFNDSHCSY